MKGLNRQCPHLVCKQTEELDRRTRKCIHSVSRNTFIVVPSGDYMYRHLITRHGPE